MNTRLVPTIILVFLAGCTCQVQAPVGTGSTQMRDWITLYRHPLEIHLSRPTIRSDKNVLVVYATGDGGWRGLDEKIFDRISGWGYPAVGFSSRSYLKNLAFVRDTTTPRRLVRDFESIIRVAEQKLDMQPSTRIILVGLSRGAGLIVVAAGQGELESNLAGVIAIALTKEEEYVVHYRTRRGSQSNQPRRELINIQTYEYLPRIASVPVVVIQSTHDGFLPADAARVLFGPDTALKKLIPINSKNHTFTGGRLDLCNGTETTLAWMYKLLNQPSSVRSR